MAHLISDTFSQKGAAKLQRLFATIYVFHLSIIIKACYIAIVQHNDKEDRYMKKSINIVCVSMLLLFCFIVPSLAVDFDENRYVQDRYDNYIIYYNSGTYWLYDTEQEKDIFTFDSSADAPSGSWLRNMYFMTDGRILYSEYRLIYPNTIAESFIYEFSPETGEKMLLRSDVAILQQDIAGRFICQQVDASGDPCLVGILDANLETELLPFIYDEIAGYGLGLYCTRTDENGTKLTGYLNEATLEWVVPMGAHSISIDNVNRQHFIIPASDSSESKTYIFDGNHVTVLPGQCWDVRDQYLRVGESSYTLRGELLPDNPTGGSYPAAWTQISSWAEDSIAEAEALDLVPETLHLLYQYPISRWEFSKLAVQTVRQIDPALVAQATEKASGIKFFDIENWSMNYFYESFDDIRIATALGITEGYPDLTFRPDAAITREEAATMLARMVKLIGLQPSEESSVTYSDQAQISAWAQDAVDTVSAAGIMNGVGEGAFAPQQTYTLEQSIVTMTRLYQLN